MLWEWELIFVHLHVSVKVTVRVSAPAGEPELRGAFRKDRLFVLAC